MKTQGIIKYLKFPLQFDATLMFSELQANIQQQWVPHFNTGGYEGNWNVLSLYAVGGKADTIFVPLTSDLELEETAILKQCPYVQEVIASFHFPKIAVRLMRLEVGAVIKPHRDHELGYEDGQFRLHIPIVTNPGVHFILDGEELTMEAGECWYTNVNYEHSVVNEGAEDRIHLVIDGVRNEWSDQLFFAEADPAQFAAPKAEMDPATIQRVIEELKRNGAAANSELIADLEKQLKPI